MGLGERAAIRLAPTQVKWGEKREHLDRFDWLWRSGRPEALATALEKVTDPAEREALYARGFGVAKRWRVANARFLGERYIDEFYAQAEPFGPGRRPDAEILWELADLYDRDGVPENAAWVCEFALASGVPPGSRDFAARLHGYREGA